MEDQINFELIMKPKLEDQIEKIVELIGSLDQCKTREEV